MNDILEGFRRALPPYLFPERKEELLEELKQFPANRHSAYYVRPDQFGEDEFLQGDCWRGLEVVEFISKRFHVGEGLLISNSCDMEPNNTGALQAFIIFAPIVKLADVERRLRHEYSEQQVTSKLRDIREQRFTNMFYLPPYSDHPESVALLDQVQSNPLTYVKSRAPVRLLALSNFGFYILLFKIAVHFCRFQEGLNRL